MKKIWLLMAAILILNGCKETVKTDENTIYVSIAPLKYIVEQIADTSFKVEILVPGNTSPETYEPTVQQIQQLADARAYIAVGLLDFELALNESIKSVAPSMKYLDLSEGVEILEGTCSHGNMTDSHGDENHGHSHFIDPHTWLSPLLVKGMAEKIAGLMAGLDPGKEAFYNNRLEQFLNQVDSLSNYANNSLNSLHNKSFAITHPSLTYYTRDYGLDQIAIEEDGKEPSAQKMKGLIDLLRKKEVKLVLTQKQISSAAAETIAKEISGKVVTFDPLAEDWLKNIYYVTDVIYSANYVQ